MQCRFHVVLHLFSNRSLQCGNNKKVAHEAIMLFLTVVACEIGRNGYFDGTDQRTGSGCLVGIMGNLSYK